MLLAALAASQPPSRLARPTPAVAANWLEMNFWLSGPRYDAELPPCDSGWALSDIRGNFGTKEGRFWNSDLSIVEVRPSPAGRVPALGRGHRSAALVLRQGAGLRRPLAAGPLFDRRGRRRDRRELGRGMVRGRARPQLGLQPALQDGAALTCSGSTKRIDRSGTARSTSEPVSFPFCSCNVLVLSGTASLIGPVSAGGVHGSVCHPCGDSPRSSGSRHHHQRGARARPATGPPRAAAAPARPVRLLRSGAVVVAELLPGQRRARPRGRRAMRHRPALFLRGAWPVAAVRARLPARVPGAGAAAQPRTDVLDARPDAGAAARLSASGISTAPAAGSTPRPISIWCERPAAR